VNPEAYLVTEIAIGYPGPQEPPTGEDSLQDKKRKMKIPRMMDREGKCIESP
jgi:hypothetical protein